MPFLAHLVDEIGPERDGLGRRVIVRAEAVAVALAGGDRRVEADADHVDDLVLLVERHAGEADVGQHAADIGVDLVLDQQLLGLAAADIGLQLVVLGDQLDLAAENAAALVDALDGDLQSDQSGLADRGRTAGKRLDAADLVRARCRQGVAQRRRPPPTPARRPRPPVRPSAAL